MSHPRRTFARVAALALVLTSFLPPAGWTLCIGPDGHVAVEPAPEAGGPCCATPGAGEAADPCTPEACSPCADVALTAGAALAASPAPSGRPQLAPAGIAALLPPLAPPLTSALPVACAGGRCACLSSPTRTTVLRF
jgi:hypothetical protein